MTAREIRDKAWRKLDKGQWFTAIVASSVILLVVILALSALSVVNGPTIKSLSSLSDIQARTAHEMVLRINDAIPLSWIVQQIIAYYFKAVMAFGISAIALAVCRNGVSFGHAFSGFGHGWRTVLLVGVMELYTFFWSLLFIIPGILAAYSYRMALFVRIDRPQLSCSAAIKVSRNLMDGHRLELFVLDLSFIGWWLLVLLTFGFLTPFVMTYQKVAEAVFYEYLLSRDDH